MSKNQFEKITDDAYGNPVYPKTEAQQRIVEAIENNKIVLIDGSAGSGKSFCSVAMAVAFLKSEFIEKVIISRPLISTEKIGFLPGDVDSKTHEYLLPLLDVFKIFFRKMKLDNKKPNIAKPSRYKEKKIKQDDYHTNFPVFTDKIIACPIAFMRGATYGAKNDAPTMIIIDEAENLTKVQVKMILTRLGDHPNSRLVINGDSSQSDLILYYKEKNGLEDACDRLKDLDGVAIIKLTDDDIVRNSIIKDVLNRYKI